MSHNRTALFVLLLSAAGAATVTPSSRAESEEFSQAQSYTQLLGALTSGRSVAVAVNFSQCSISGTGTSGPQVVGGFFIDSYLVPNNLYIAFSDVHETLSPQNARVTEYTRYRVTPDGQVSIRTASVLLSDGTLSNQAEYQCAIGKGIHFHETIGVRGVP